MKTQIIALCSIFSVLYCEHTESMFNSTFNRSGSIQLNSPIYEGQVLDLKSSHETLKKFRIFPNLKTMEVDINDLNFKGTFPKLKTLKIYGTLNKNPGLSRKDEISNNKKFPTIDINFEAKSLEPIYEDETFVFLNNSKILEALKRMEIQVNNLEIISYKIWQLPSLERLILNNQLLPNIPKYTISKNQQEFVMKEITIEGIEGLDNYFWNDYKGWISLSENKKDIWPINIYLNQITPSKEIINQVTTKFGDTLLNIESLYGRFDFVKWLVEHGADVNAKTNKGWSSLYIACLRRNYDIVKFLIDNNADTNSLTNIGWTPLMLSSENGAFEISKLLVENNSNVNIKAKDSSTALYAASQNGHLEIVNLLIENEANVNDHANGHWTPLMVASEHGHCSIVDLLIKNGAKVNEASDDGWTALMLASENGHLEIAKSLTAAGADVNAVTSDGISALYVATINEHIDVIKLLLETQKVSPKIFNGIPKYSPLQAALTKNFLDIAESFLAYGADINAPICSEDLTALHVASIEKRFDLMEWLINHNADIDCQAQNEATPSMFAISLGQQDVMQWLIEHGADINKTNKFGETLLMFAAKDGRLMTVNWLLSRGAHINIQDEKGFTPLMWAALYGRFKVVELLVKNGAEIDTEAKDGSNAPQLAATHRHWETVDFLAKKLSIKKQKISPEGINLPPTD